MPSSFVLALNHSNQSSSPIYTWISRSAWLASRVSRNVHTYPRSNAAPWPTAYLPPFLLPLTFRMASTFPQTEKHKPWSHADGAARA